MLSSVQPDANQYRQEFSSSFIFSVQAAFLEPFDWLFTFFYRWPLMLFRDIQLKNAATASHASFGPLEWTALHPHATEMGVVFIGFLSLAKACGFWSETEYQNEIMRQVHHEQCEEKQVSVQHKLKTLREKQPTLSNEALIKKLNDRMQNPQEGNFEEKKFFAKFKKAKIVADKEGQPSLELPTEFKFDRMMLAIWTTLFLSAFYFWIGWIVMVSLTATITNGIPDCTFLVSFILPLAISALTYMGFKGWHWINHRFFDVVSKTPEEKFQQASLLEYLLNEQLKEEKLDHTTILFDSTPKPTNAKELASYEAVIGFLSGFLQAQYILWISSALLTEYLHFAGDLSGTLLASDFGIGTLIAAVGFAFKAYNDRYSALEERVDIKINLDKIENIDAAIAKLNRDIFTLKNQLVQKNWENQNVLRYFFERLGKKEYDFFNSLYYKVFCDYTMSSVFVGRVLLLSNTSPFLPAFFHMAAIATSLSNPVTWALLFLVAAGWSAFRYHARVQESKLKEERDLISQVKNEKYLALVKEEALLNGRIDKASTASYFSPGHIGQGLSKVGMFARSCLPSPSSDVVTCTPRSIAFR